MCNINSIIFSRPCAFSILQKIPGDCLVRLQRVNKLWWSCVEHYISGPLTEKNYRLSKSLKIHSLEKFVRSQRDAKILLVLRIGLLSSRTSLVKSLIVTTLSQVEDSRVRYLLGRVLLEYSSSTIRKMGLDHLRYAAEKQHREAQYLLGGALVFDEEIAGDKSQGVQWLLQASQSGSAPAQCALGYVYAEGLGVMQDDEIAMRWFQHAAENGHVRAHYELGVIFALGKGIMRDDVRAVQYFRIIADQIPEAQSCLGWAYEAGLGVKRNLKTALHHYLAAARKGVKEAQFRFSIIHLLDAGESRYKALAIDYFRKTASSKDVESQYVFGYQNEQRGDLKTAMMWYRNAAEQGFAPAQARFACALEDGEGIEKDVTKAVHWNRAAAAQGIASAQFNLARAYIMGRGVAPDLNQGMFWIREAAIREFPLAEINMGIAHREGFFLPKDEAAGMFWHQRAAEHGLVMAPQCHEANIKASTDEEAKAEFQHGQNHNNDLDLKKAAENFQQPVDKGHLQAKFELAAALELGQGVEENTKEALRLYDQAATKGHREAQYQMGLILRYGRYGQNNDAQAAMKWFIQAGLQGHSEAQANVATLMFDKSIDSETIMRAFAVVKMGAEEDNEMALYALGQAYEKGIGVEKKPVEAIEWYRKAAAKGDVRAKSALQRLQKSH